MKTFLSSTFTDLKEHRRLVIEALERLDQKVNRMEVFGARPAEPQTACLKEVEDSDLFVGIYAHRYGSVPAGSEFSITEQEFNHAIKSNKPMFCFLINEDHPWPPNLIEGGPGHTRLATFKLRINNCRVRDVFTTADDLALKVATAIGRHLLQLSEDKPGSDPQESVADAKVQQKDCDLDKKFSLPPFTDVNSAVFFARRFALAFPGLRNITWFQSIEAVERLRILLADPIVFSGRGGCRLGPIWWFGRGNSQIERFNEIDTTTVLIDIHELKLDRIAAVYSPSYKRLFVYVEAEPMEPTGLYPRIPGDIEECRQKLGCVSEEYGLYQGIDKITRAEYDDNAARIDGKLVQFDNDVELRVRYITPYNMVIAANESTINNNEFDIELESWLNILLREPTQFDQFIQKVNKLYPRGHG